MIERMPFQRPGSGTGVDRAADRAAAQMLGLLQAFWLIVASFVDRIFL
jgi:hypothetical protein